jgi:hypothetical protein
LVATATEGMYLQPIIYRGRLVAAATACRFFLSEEPEHGDPAELPFVTFMCAYARDVLTGQLPGPYREQDARRYARWCLLAPGLGELLERPKLDVSRAAQALGIPEAELIAVRATADRPS